MSDIDVAVKALCDCLADSDEYREYARTLAAVKEIPGLKQRVDEFREHNYRLQNSPDVDFDKLEQFERENSEFREIPEVSRFLAAELSLCRLVQRIQRGIVNSIDFE